MKEKLQACLAELIATFTLVFIGAGAVCLEASRGGIGLVGIALAHGLAIFVMVAATAHISGGHINPAVTLGLWVARKISPELAVGYIFSQLLGGVLGAFALKCIYPGFVTEAPFLGTPVVAGITFGQAICVEAILTFLVVFVVFATAVDSRGTKLAPLAIGMTVTLDILMGGPLTGGAMNPARAFGPAFVTGQWLGNSVYWAGPFLGGIAAAFVYKFAFLKKGG